MKKLKHLFVFDNLFLVTFLLVINLYFQNIYLFLFSLFYLLIRLKFKAIITFLLFLVILILALNLKLIKWPYYIVTSTSKSEAVASNLVYSIKIKEPQDYLVGDIVKIDATKLELITSKTQNAKNIYYEYRDLTQHITAIYHLRRLFNQRINHINDVKVQSLIRKIILQVNDYETLERHFLAVASSIYLFNRLLNKLLDLTKIAWPLKKIIILFIGLELFGLNFTFLRILIFDLFKNHNNQEKAFTLPVLFLLLLNPKCIFQIGFQFSLLIRTMLLFKDRIDFKAYLMALEAYLFNEVNLAKLVFYRAYMSFNLVVYLTSIICLLFNKCDFTFIYHIVNFVESTLRLNIKGHINLFILIYGLCLFYHYHLNRYGQMLCISLLLLSNISNVFGTVTFIDVGQGDAILIRAPFNQENILIDTGPPFSYYKLQKTLDAYGIYQIDHLVVTHSDEDHIGNLKALVNDYLVQEIIYEPKDFNSLVGEFVSLNEPTYDNPNDNSIVYALNYAGRLRFVFTGDISKKIEEIIIDHYPQLCADVLKLSHHGSKSGSSLRFLYYLNPYYGIASTNGRYGHPHQEVIENLNKMDISLLSTHKEGNISFIFTNLLQFMKSSNGGFVIIR